MQHICTPTRQAFMSGRYQIHTGLQHDIIKNSQKSCLPPAFATVADLFQVGGYATAMIGKWHLGLYKSECLPWNRGFDSFYGFLTGSELHYTKMQRSARGSPGNASHKVLYPDFRSHEGPIDSPCVEVPPHIETGSALVPQESRVDMTPSPTPVKQAIGMATSGLLYSDGLTFTQVQPEELSPAANWTFYSGALVAGSDVGNGNFTLAAAQQKCLHIPQCLGFTFESFNPSRSSCISEPCKMYFKSVRICCGGELTRFDSA